VLAEAYAGAGKTRLLGAADLGKKATHDFVEKVEQSIVHYGKSTGFFTEKMLARGPGYLSATVTYENLVIESYGKASSAPFPLVALYPTEGTFWSDHPYAILDADWVDDEHRRAAEAFLAFLKARPQQERALALGFRPADPAVATTAPIDAAHGVDPKQPQTLLEVPDAATLSQLLAMWRGVKRPADVILLFDKSGSMEGEPLAAAKRGAEAFLDGLHDRDTVTLIPFDNLVYAAQGPFVLPQSRARVAAGIEGLFAGGGTALYDGIDAAFKLSAGRARLDRSRTHTVVVMTDGMDESSSLTLAGLEGRLPHEGDQEVGVFTIAYGAQANSAILGRIAEVARGTSARGDVRDIVQVYQEMASFF
jgi:Ca-activated chloride channel family protein